MKKQYIVNSLAVAALLALGAGCATYEKKVTVVEDTPSGTTTIIRETPKEVKKTTYHPTQVGEPTIKVAPDSELKP